MQYAWACRNRDPINVSQAGIIMQQLFLTDGVGVGGPDRSAIKTLATVTMPYDSADTAPTVSTTPAEDVAHKALRTIIDIRRVEWIVNDGTFAAEVHVVPGLADQLLLGSDFMDKHHMMMLWSSRELHFPAVEPRGVRVPFTLEVAAPDGTDVLCTPFPGDGRAHTLMDATAATVNAGTITVPAINTTGSTQRSREREAVGLRTPLSHELTA
ncbi:hypothetical protein DYB25_005377 [Aphanomyces astaci]|uniref:Uncharacterized protein n=1 Tax=Aphanomyces astaci TaxID=112090 RepID=A0A397DI70_APHAT|nr:hypothetical protein DYB25_005377 [Aphanomyces astaci]RHY42675.1 hypothetical protein DYB34_012100 [Aphanomyces astaci]RHY65773.1 hypothetical protein DYB38_006547 [Aphanomyces astaci]RHZ09392.1 hypothetical protein DYB31_004857 [Aphanomyces astaci]RHZ21352.1 hypothetical protein DYB26_002788 [Aphanomyces astaci]